MNVEVCITSISIDQSRVLISINENRIKISGTQFVVSTSHHHHHFNTFFSRRLLHRFFSLSPYDIWQTCNFIICFFFSFLSMCQLTEMLYGAVHNFYTLSKSMILWICIRFDCCCCSYFWGMFRRTCFIRLFIVCFFLFMLLLLLLFFGCFHYNNNNRWIDIFIHIKNKNKTEKIDAFNYLHTNYFIHWTDTRTVARSPNAHVRIFGNCVKVMWSSSSFTQSLPLTTAGYYSIVLVVVVVTVLFDFTVEIASINANSYLNSDMNVWMCDWTKKEILRNNECVAHSK